MKRTRLAITLLASSLGLIGQLAFAQLAQIRVADEFIYPTEYEPPQVAAAGANVAGGGAVAISPGVPTSFKMREQGARLSVYAAIVSGPRERAALAELMDQQKSLTGNTDLIIAATTGNTDAVKTLLAKGGDVEARNNHGSSALMGAAAGGHDEIIKLLLDHKADVDGKGRKDATPLMYAAKNGHLAVVQTLLKRGAKLNAVDDEGRNALIYAANGGQMAVVQALLNAGANPKIRTPTGETAQAHAEASGNRAVAVLLSSVTKAK